MTVGEGRPGYYLARNPPMTEIGLIVILFALVFGSLLGWWAAATYLERMGE